MKAGILVFSIVLISIIISLSIIVLGNKQKPTPPYPIKSTLPAQVKSYQNQSGRFTLTYPNSFVVTENSDQVSAVISNKKGEVFRLEVVASDSARFRKLPLQYILEICKSASQSATFTKDSQSVIANKNGTIGSIYYLKKDSGDSNERLGPFIVFPRPSSGLNPGNYIIFYPRRLSASDREVSGFMDIISTVSFY